MSSEFIFENKTFTVQQLYRLLGFATNPSDRELEAKIIMYIRKHNGLSGDSNIRLYQFFGQVYDYFFDSSNSSSEIDSESDSETSSSSDLKEGFVDAPVPIPVAPVPIPVAPVPIQGNVVVPTTMAPPISVNTIEYSADVMNPILQQTVQRIVSIDSRYRNLNATNSNLYPHSTNFTIELSEPLRDVLSLKLYSYQIPYTWFIINSDYGSNFFILKGTSPGLSDFGTYDFKIAIEPGNYNSTQLISAVNQSISAVAAVYTDVHFGETKLVYNAINTKASFTVDIQQIFHESSFQLDWHTWSSPENVNRGDVLYDIPIYLGYNSPLSNIHTIYSVRNSIPSIVQTAYADINQANYYITEATSFFRIIHYYNVPIQDMNAYYKVPEYDAASSTILDTFTLALDLPTGNYSRHQIQSKLSAQIQSASFLHSSASDLSRIDQTDVPYSYYRMNLPLNRTKSKIRKDSKTVIQFPDESGIPVGKFPIWTGSDSCFQFNSDFLELNNIISEFPLYPSNYIILNTPCIDLVCHATGYTHSDNTVRIRVLPSPNTQIGYNIIEYVAAIQASLVDAGVFNFPSTQFSLDVVSKPQLFLDYNLTFSNSDYSISFSSSVLFNGRALFSGTNVDLVTTPFITLATVSIGSVYILSSIDEFFTLTPNGNFGVPFIVPFNPSRGTSTVSGYQYTNFNSFFNDLSDSINLFSDVAGSFPLGGSTLSYTIANTDGINYYSIQLSLRVAKHLTQRDFDLHMYDTDLSGNIYYPGVDPDIIIDGSAPQSSWGYYLKFTEYSVDLSLADYNHNPPVSKIMSTANIDGETLTVVDGTNNTFYFRPQAYSAGLVTQVRGIYTGDYYNDLRVTIPAGIYSNIALFNAMNTAFSAQSKTRGTYIEPVTIGTQQYCKLRVNINHSFTVADYVLHFYDIESFVKCYVGATSVRNTTWDTTLGWILGFHDQTSYVLFLYMDVDTGVATLTGENSLSTNLYSYFLISMDDFNQNRLNDGLVTISKKDSTIPLPSYSSAAHYVCNNSRIVTNGSTLNNLTGNQLFAINQVLESQKTIAKIYSQGPIVKDVFAIVPLKLPSNSGDMITEYGGSLQNQNRIYFGPVHIRRLQIQLFNDQGTLMDLNGADWSFSFICEQLYHKGTKGT